MPVDAICIALMGAPEVATVQVGHVAVIVPPGSLVLLGTVARVAVVVLVLGGESEVVVVRQGVACSEGRVGVHTHSTGGSWVLGPGQGCPAVRTEPRKVQGGR